MSQQLVNLDEFKNKYPVSANEAFEELATLMFMKRLNLPHSPIRRKGQAGIEADPVDVPYDIDHECKAGKYAYQAKFLEPKTEISDKKEELLRSIEVARQEEVTDLFIYVNKEMHQNSKTRNKPNTEKKLEQVAKEAKIKLHWYEKKGIQTDLNTLAYDRIKQLFFGRTYTPDILGFYEYNCRKMTRRDDKAAYGSMSLLDSYIEPLLRRRTVEGTDPCSLITENAKSENTFSVREYLETWVEGDQYVMILCGEPGHGKTSLCCKAMYDFYKENWLRDKVLNVFAFSINPAGSVVQDKKELDSVEALFSWGNTLERQKEGHELGRDVCGNALIFLDGFDELLEWIPGYSMECFLEEVFEFLKYDDYFGCRKPHIVITTRKMAIDPRKDEYILTAGYEEVRVPIYELQLIPKNLQYEWIRKHGNIILDKSRGIKTGQSADCKILENSDMLNNKHSEIIELTDTESYLEKYIKMYESLAPQDELKQILGIPIIFRMIVTQNYIPTGDYHLSSIYDKLFDITWARYNNDRSNKKHDKAVMKKRLMRHALRIYLDNNDTAEVSYKIEDEEAAWLYAFFTRYDSSDKKLKRGKFKSRVGFLHKTLYEHFLACEILSWFRYFEEDDSPSLDEKQGNGSNDKKELIGTFQDKLSLLGKRKLSIEILSSVRELYENSQEKEDARIEDEAFDKAYDILKDTDGIIFSPVYSRLVNEMNANTPLVRGENVFFNIISICSVCRHPVNAEKINVRSMRYYDLNGIRLDGASFREENLEGARLENAYLGKVDFTGAKLNRVSLSDSILSGSFDEANLNQANLTGALLLGSFIRADFKRASLSEAICRGSFDGADMEEALLSCAVFDQENMQARLSEVNLEGARISQASLSTEQLSSLRLKRVIGKPRNKLEGYWNYELSSEWKGRMEDFPIEIEKYTNSVRKVEYARIPAFGRYRQGPEGETEPLSWRILKRESDKALVISEKLIDCISYNETWETGVTWESCTLRDWLNEDFLYAAFNKKEREKILRSRNINSSSNSNSSAIDSRSPTWDKIFMLSIDEVEQYFTSDIDRRAAVTEFVKSQKLFSNEFFKTYDEELSGWWWLRSPGLGSTEAAHVYHSGAINRAGDYVNIKGICVRPVLWLKLDFTSD